MRKLVLICAAVFCAALFSGCGTPGICRARGCSLIAVTADRYYCTYHSDFRWEPPPLPTDDMTHRCAVVCQVCGEKLDPPQWIRAVDLHGQFRFFSHHCALVDIPVCSRHKGYTITINYRGWFTYPEVLLRDTGGIGCLN